MPRIVTLQLLVEADDDASAVNVIDRALQPMMQQRLPDSRLIDFRLYGIGDKALEPYVATAVIPEPYTSGAGFPTMQMALPARSFAFPQDPTGQAQRDCADRLHIEVFAPNDPENPPGVTGNMEVQINRTHEGIILDVWAGDQCIHTAGIEYSDAAAAQEEQLAAA